ncbi:MAG: hypothetical protein AAGI38_02365 [Bacteroidota bacterium]
MKKAVIIGSSGMVGKVVLNLCLEHPEISQVISWVRKPSGISHPNLLEVVTDDLVNYPDAATYFADVTAAYCCVGVYTGAVPKDVFRKVTTDIPIAFAKALYAHSPAARYCFLSGQGADRTGKSAMMFARDKGDAENAISDLAQGRFFTFRPGYIYPVEKREEPSFGYRLMRNLYPVFRLLGKNVSITSEQLAQAIFQVGMDTGSYLEELENKDIINVIE